jgi:DNA-binding transcriptional ArsR family regulator
MLRIHFTADDLIRVRVAPDVDVLWEVLHSLTLLGKSEGEVVFGDWKRKVQPHTADPMMRTLLELAPPWGYSADFLTPTSGVKDPSTGLDTVAATPRSRLRTDIAKLAGPRSSAFLRDLYVGDGPALARLCQALGAYYDLALAPYWDTITAQVRADRAVRAQAMLEGGTELLLSTLHPMAQWEPPVLRINYPYDRHLHLSGRGLVMVPSFFCWLLPMTLQDADLPPVLTYPIDHEMGWLSPRRGDGRASLAALLGRTRAAVLEALADTPGCTTTELARRVGTSLPTASQQLGLLREAGLTVRRQRGRSVLHALTPLGVTLVRGNGRRL